MKLPLQRAAIGLVLTIFANDGKVGVAQAAVPAKRAVSLNAKLCVPATDAQKKSLTEEWKPFLDDVIACPLKIGRAGTLMTVLSADGESFARGIKPGQIVPELPKAWIVLPDETRVGILPYAFPFDPPVSLGVTFTDWRQGWPQKVKLFLEDPTVSGNQRLPSLKWDSHARTFATTGEAHGK